jgi:DNA mismatch repair protein MutS2
MQAAVYRALEFDVVREVLAQAALTPLGRARVRALEPVVSPGLVRAGLVLTTEAAAFVSGAGSLAILAPDDLETLFLTLDVADQPLEPLGLLALGQFVESVTQIGAALQRASSWPGLGAIGARVARFDDEIAAIRRAIESSGDVRDTASPALAEIRDALRQKRAKLRASLDALAHGRDTAKYLQDQIVTDRNGRYVLVVRAEHRDAIPGIVHGSSASGQSLYLEPLATVALNNDVVALTEREKAEVRRILLALTDAFRRRGDDLESTLDASAEIDELHAKVDLARRVEGIAPGVTEDGRVEFRGARHPLLIPAVRDRQADVREVGVVVASDLLIVPPARALVISGPNTGGKTVALKATGLLALMAQAGLLIPVDPGSRFTPFRTIFADIGDDQSIAASLSTFSARIANLVEMERALELPALVLLDEVGSGTDPVEGGALGTAIIDHFRRRGAIVIATTHDEALKSYAVTTDGVITAGFGFDPATYAPTYRLLYGAPGRSLAFEIAERLGMPADVIADGRARRSGRESLLAAHLSQVDRELAAIELERQRVQTDRDAVARERDALLARESRLAEREAVVRKRADDKLNEKLREARAEVDRVVKELRQKADQLAEDAGRRATRGPVLSTGDIGSVRAEAKAALGAIGTAAGALPDPDDDVDLPGPPKAGQRVFVKAFGTEGLVRSVSGHQVDVEVRGKRLRVSVKDLAVTKGDGGRSVENSGRGKPSAGGFNRGSSEALVTPVHEIVLVGATVDEALDRAAKFLDDAILHDARRLRVVHGHGTGRLREALTKFFREHPLVASVAPAAANEGGAGATILELKD